ncbi:hypothetical protein ABZ666_30740 [Streptomyces sp. NPDC007056]|uniref:hypothetical protein n=1 Tax=unclassified Streptomyces TaxID=2593676 RepID=UPI0033E88535
MTAPKPVVVVGDVLLDEDIEGVATRLAQDAPAPVVDVTGDRRHPGGAGLAAALTARGGRDVTLVTALGDDPASEAVRRGLSGRVRLLELPLHGTLPVKTRVLAGGRWCASTGAAERRASRTPRCARHSRARTRCSSPTTGGTPPERCARIWRTWPVARPWCGTRIPRAIRRFRERGS